MHEVIHIIHKNCDKFCGLHSVKIEQRFCAHTIKLDFMKKSTGKTLDKPIVKKLKIMSKYDGK